MELVELHMGALCAAIGIAALAALTPGPSQAPLAPAPGSFNVVGQSGVPPMHAALLENGRVVFLDKVENYTQLQLSDGQYAYSAEYDPASNMVVALAYKTNAFCSGGHFLANGTLACHSAVMRRSLKLTLRVLLPLSSTNQWNPDIIICGGGQYQDITSPTDPSCGRIQPLSQNANWEMDSMPEGRGMVEGTMLPDGTVVFLNGCNEGAQGFGLAQDPTLEALIYDPTQPLGERWSNAANTTIARLYHSVALLLLDGTVMVAGSNPVQMPILQPSAQNPYVTEFRVEIYTPPYLSGDNANNRPTGVTLSTTALHADSSTFTITFNVPAGAQSVQVALYTNGFVTHSLHMGQRLAYLDSTGWVAGATAQTVIATMPPSPAVVPPGPYVVYVVVDGIPAIGQFVLVS
ncbi:MAG: hypothetical protein M1822_000900 [Bathelium mastoideum]|nr:MAG: hypothetical protein M1822_000900 [Bathelium mastoideum]